MTAYDHGLIAGIILSLLVGLAVASAYVIIRDWLDERAWNRVFRSKRLPRAVAMRSQRR